MENRIETVISCPHCKYQFHPAEIFLPVDFTGKPEEIIKDSLGKILYVDYQKNYEPVSVEHFTCENCGRPFVVEVNVSYKAKKEAEELDFSSQTVSLLD